MKNTPRKEYPFLREEDSILVRTTTSTGLIGPLVEIKLDW